MARKKLTLLLFIFLISLPIGAKAERSLAVVVYPQVSSTYGRLIDAMIKGMKNNSILKISKYEINKNTSINEVREIINQDANDAVVSLGGFALDMVKKTSPSIPIIASATLLNSDTKAGISLIGDPEEFMKLLGRLAPNIKRVHVVYNKYNSHWYIKRSVSAANTNRITLKAYEAENVNEAAIIYKNIMNKVDGKHDAVWILMDRVIPQNAILPEILQQAWDKNIITFSSNPVHVKQGVLFALYPNYEKIGHDLVKLTDSIISNAAANLIHPATGMKSSVNVRTASHLGLRISPLQLEKFDSVFPTH